MPIAALHPHDVVSPNGTRSDPYYWLRDDSRQSEEVLAYLKAENAHTAEALAPTAALQATLYDEIVGRIAQDDETVPTLDHGYWYYQRYQTGKQYAVSLRRKGSMQAPEEVIVDDNELAAGHPFFARGSGQVSLDGRLFAYTEDTVGRNQFVLRIKDLSTGAMLPDTVANVTAHIAWANDGRTIFYVAKDPVTLRSRKVFRHTLGTPSTDDVLVHDETDEAFYTGIGRSKSDRFLVIHLRSTVSTEARLIDADHPTEAPRVFAPRQRDHEYELDHVDGRFLIRTNWDAKNFRLMEVAEQDFADRGAWRELTPQRDDVFLAGFGAYRDFIALSERSGGLKKVRILPRQGQPFEIAADDPTYSMGLLDLPAPDSAVVRYSYTSLTTPDSTFELDLASGNRTLLKRQPVLGDFDPARYVSEHLWATARDGTRVPISVVRRKDVDPGKAPLLVYGYGAYGMSMDPYFSIARLSLLDRGWVYAIAHVRGGQEMGRPWYEAGRQLQKKNSFTDFVDATEFLVAQGQGDRDQVFAMGGSAGGLLMGAIVNLRPDLYRGIVAQVPFVDVVTTMLDTTIPLTSNEFDEWGNPEEKAFYDYMLSYSPYDNVAAVAYPSMLVTTGLWDSQVQYFEPAKWVARLRATRTDDNLLLLHVNMEAGHGGKSGRYERFRETARDFAFLLHVASIPDRRR
jgi:oligopeptidase B